MNKGYLQDKLDTFYDSFDSISKVDINSGFLTIQYKNKIINARVVTPIKKGKVTVIKTGESYFVTQDSANQSKEYVKIEKSVEVYRPFNFGGDIFLIVVVLSEKVPINIELRNNTNIDVDLLPNLQVVEDIYLVGSPKTQNLILEELRLDRNSSLVTEPYLTFFSFLKQQEYKSFYNYLAGATVKDEGLKRSSFILDTFEESQSKLHILDFIFPNSGLYDMFTISTAVVKDSPYNPFNLELRVTERPNQMTTFQELLLKFYSSYLAKIKNLVVLNNLFPNVDGFNYRLKVEVIGINYETKTVTYIQLNKPFSNSLIIENYDKIRVGSTGIIRQLNYGNYFEEI